MRVLAEGASTSARAYAMVFDLDKLLAGAPDQGLIGKVVNPDPRAQTDRSIVGSFHDYWVGYDPATDLWSARLRMPSSRNGHASDTSPTRVASKPTYTSKEAAILGRFGYKPSRLTRVARWP